MRWRPRPGTPAKAIDRQSHIPGRAVPPLSSQDHTKLTPSDGLRWRRSVLIAYRSPAETARLALLLREADPPAQCIRPPRRRADETYGEPLKPPVTRPSAHYWQIRRCAHGSRTGRLYGDCSVIWRL